MIIQVRGSGTELDKWFDKWDRPCREHLWPELQGTARMFNLHNVVITFYAKSVPFDTLGSADIIDSIAIVSIFLANHASRPQIRRTALHELYHIYQLQIGIPVNENAAERFAWQGIIS